MHNINIESFKCLVRLSHFTKDESDNDTFDRVYAFGVQSVTGRILTFHIMTDYGMLRSRVPISELFIKKPEKDIPPDFKQLWDCFSENVSYTKFEYLSGKRCQVVLKDKTIVWASYLFTVDWYSNPYSDEPSDYKCGHVLIADEGYFLCQPNNRIYWRDANWVTKPFTDQMKKRMSVDEKAISVESTSDRWVSGDGNEYYYEIKKTDDKGEGGDTDYA